MMSDTMLHAVLQMPPEIWSDTELDKMQRHSRYMQASKRIEEDGKELDRLQAIEAAARNLVKVKGRYHTEQAFKALVAALENTP